MCIRDRFSVDFHALVVQTVLLGEVDDVKLDWACEVLILDLEIEPLMMPTGVRVHSHVEVKLPRADLDGHVQITRLKPRVKVQIFGRVVSCELLQILHLSCQEVGGEVLTLIPQLWHSLLDTFARQQRTHAREELGDARAVDEGLVPVALLALVV